MNLFDGSHVPIRVSNRGPETLRLISEEGKYLLQNWAEKTKKWITQKDYVDRDIAISDCDNWYK